MTVRPRLYQRAGSKRWEFTYRDKSNRRVYRRCPKDIVSRTRAWDYATEKIAEEMGGKRQVPTLGEYAAEFFVWDKCPYTRRQVAAKRRFSPYQAAKRRSNLEKYVLPTFQRLRLDEIRRRPVQDWLIGLKVAPQTANHILHTFRIVMREAEADGYIEASPLERVQPMGKAPKARDAFTWDDLWKLFPQDEERCLEIWRDRKHYAAFLILATGGLRSGELRALEWRDYEKGALFVQRAVKAGENGIGPTKSGDDRVVLLPRRTIAVLDAWRAETEAKAPTHLIFPGDGPRIPWTRRALRHALLIAMPKAMVDTAGRNLVVHSFRHAYNTIMRRTVPGEVLRALTGHKSERMSEHYDHPTLQDRLRQLESAREIVEQVWQLPADNDKLSAVGGSS